MTERSDALRTLRTGASRLTGFGLSILLLAATALLSVPAMIAASGPNAFAAIVTGQAIGAVAATLIHYGWAITGPAAIARAERGTRLSEFVISIRVRASLLIPLAVIAALVAAAMAPGNRGLAALGAVAAASIGLQSTWYFVGIGKPYLLLLLETVPRATGTFLGVLAMYQGASAAAGLIGQLAGMLTGFVITSTWILTVGGRPPGWSDSLMTVGQALRSHWHGVVASAIPNVYAAMPIVLVGLVAPASLPAFAILDKFGRQVTAALSPFIAVLQGWVPQAERSALPHRIRQALLVTSGAAVLLAAAVAIVGEPIIRWLSNDQIPVPQAAIVLLGMSLGARLLASVIARACLVPLGRLKLVILISAVGALTGVLFILVLTPGWGVTGAAAGLLIGTGTMAGLGLVGLRRHQRHQSPPASSG